ncbi:hypothetical protein [Streptomyces sp. BA2]|uniref:hypothetical protein n=1 Tax=Streptomyces sp. BA2 TaxID=436595 RepID=UPI001F456CE1|nr:hypothetical protein [Streptomyces sp. BA2]
MRVDPDSDFHPDASAPAWRWRAAALGDRCLFHLHHDRLAQSFPVVAVEEFDTTPDLFSSRNHDVALLARRTRSPRAGANLATGCS